MSGSTLTNGHDAQRGKLSEITLRELCDECSTALGVSGASITLTTRHDGDGASASTEAFQGISEAQFTLGEGPEIDALRARDLVVAPNVESLTKRWPLFVVSAREYGVSSVMATPLTIGSINFGVLTLYERRPDFFNDANVSVGLAVAKTATWFLLAQHEALDGQALPLFPTDTLPYRAVVHQASGMVAAQLNCDLAEALVRLRARAYAEQRSITEIAQAIVRREIRLQP